MAIETNGLDNVDSGVETADTALDDKAGVAEAADEAATADVEEAAEDITLLVVARGVADAGAVVGTEELEVWTTGGSVCVSTLIVLPLGSTLTCATMETISVTVDAVLASSCRRMC